MSKCMFCDNPGYNIERLGEDLTKVVMCDLCNLKFRQGQRRNMLRYEDSWLALLAIRNRINEAIPVMEPTEDISNVHIQRSNKVPQ